MSGVTGIGGQGMVAPQNAFVNGSGQLNPVSFSFLFNVFKTAQSLLAQMAQAQTDLATANTNIASANSGVASNAADIATLQAQVAQIQSDEASEPGSLANIQAQINTINARLAAAGIP